MDVSEFTADNLQPFVGTDFRVELAAGGECLLRMTELTKIRDKHVDARFKRDSFSIVLEGPRQPFLPQGTYQLQHDNLGANHIFIVPTGPAPEGFRYEAVFT
ncbi:MAG: hypothetical protein ABI837_12870 [Acidobacteriota bacterium]